MVQKIISSRIFWATALLLMVVIFVSLVNRTQTYLTETRILILPKSELAAQNIDQIIENAQNIPLSLSFYDKMLEKNQEIIDEAQDFESDKRKDYWNSKIHMERVGKSGILQVEIFEKDNAQSQLINDQVTTDLIKVLGLYYDIKNDIDVRIIDGPVTKYTRDGDMPVLFSISVIAGGVITFIIFFIINLISDSFAEPAQPKFPSFSLSGLHDQLNSRIDIIKPLNKEESPKTEESFEFQKPAESAVKETKENQKKNISPESPKPYSFSSEKKSSAPSNLPVANDEALKEVEKRLYNTKTEEPKPTPEKSPLQKPTPEEVKERLNKLLGGKF